MNSSASRGAILIIAAIVIGAIVLGKGFDDDFGSDSVAPADGGSSDNDSDDGDEITTNEEGVTVGQIDTDGDGEPDTAAIDTNGDGEPDTEATDESGDGIVDTPVGGDAPFTPIAKDPADVRVLVANATGVNGAAANATSQLIARNYATLDPTNATDRLEATVVYYEPDYEADAQLVAQILSARPEQLAPMPVADPAGVDRRGANILVMLGADEVTQPPEAETETDG